MAGKTKRTATPDASTPMPIHVQDDDVFRPVVLVLEDRFQTVDSIDDRCEVEADWCKDNPVVQMYYREGGGAAAKRCRRVPLPVPC